MCVFPLFSVPNHQVILLKSIVSEYPFMYFSTLHIFINSGVIINLRCTMLFCLEIFSNQDIMSSLILFKRVNICTEVFELVNRFYKTLFFVLIF